MASIDITTCGGFECLLLQLMKWLVSRALVQSGGLWQTQCGLEQKFGTIMRRKLSRWRMLSRKKKRRMYTICHSTTTPQSALKRMPSGPSGSMCFCCVYTVVTAFAGMTWDGAVAAAFQDG